MPVQYEGEAGLDSFIYEPPKEELQQEAWRITELVLEEIHQEVQQHHATLVIAAIASGIQVHPDASIRQAFATRLGIADLDYADRRIEAVAEELGALVISLGKPMRSYAESHGRFLHGFENTQLGTGHWNVDGHRVAGEIIARRLCQSRSLLDLATR